MDLDPLAVALALVVAALSGALALLGIVRSDDRTEPVVALPTGRGNHRAAGEYPDRPSGHRPMHRREPVALDGLPLAGLAAGAAAGAAGMLVAYAAGPVSAVSRQFSDVLAVLFGWAL
jgi:hypothetical protein